MKIIDGEAGRERGDVRNNGVPCEMNLVDVICF